ncbi:MAG: ribonuclease Z [Lachnospiraceae bacterium]|nr:ribonuclease Z [Lachnospiraceae bacterium]
MLDVCLLGCGGMMPLPYRWLTSLMVRYNGSTVLIDCGEGTQIAIREKGWSFKPIDVICFTHFHGDHISGLPGLLLTMGNAERTKPLTLIGPKGLERVVRALRVVAPELPFPIEYIELSEKQQTIDILGLSIDAFRVQHNVVCYGYRIRLRRQGRFDAIRAKELGIPVQYWNLLQKGNVITDGDVSYTPDMVLGPERRGLTITYCTDTRPVPVIEEYARNSDLFICEGMYGEEDKLSKAKEHKHMTFYEAAELARQAQPGTLWLTHYSPSLVHPEQYLQKVQEIFPATELGRDGKTVQLDFEDA